MSNINQIINDYKNNGTLHNGLALLNNSVPGVRQGIRAATNTGLSTESTLWSGGNSIYEYLPAAQTLTVSSSSVNDDVGSTGAQAVEILGLDANYEKAEEIVLLDGQNPVTTETEWVFIDYLLCRDPGSNKTNEGDVYAGDGLVTAGVPATVVAKANAGEGIGVFGGFCVPKDNTAYVTSFNLLPKRNDDGSVFAVTEVPNYARMYLFKLQFSDSPANVDLEYGLFDFFEEQSKLQLRAVADSGNVSITGLLQVLFVNNATINKL